MSNLFDNLFDIKEPYTKAQYYNIYSQYYNSDVLTIEQAKKQEYPCIAEENGLHATFWIKINYLPATKEYDPEIEVGVLSKFPTMMGDHKYIFATHCIDEEFDMIGAEEALFDIGKYWNSKLSQEEIWAEILKEHNMEYNKPYCIKGKMIYSGPDWEGEYDAEFQWEVIETNMANRS